MGSKTIVFLGLLLATLVFITSEVTARNLVETSKKASKSIFESEFTLHI